MYLSSKYTLNDSQPQTDADEQQHQHKVLPQSQLGRGKDQKLKSKSSEAWKRKDGAITNSITESLGSKPFAQVGEAHPPDPAARLPDSTEIQHAPTPNYHPQLNQMEPSSGDRPDSRKVVVSIPDELLATLRSHCEAKTSVSLLGRIQGKHPGLKALTAWARDFLHTSLSLLSLKTNNIFEVTFEHPEGRVHALNQADLTCGTAAIFFSSWQPHFDARHPNDTDNLDHPVWMQIVDLCHVLREETFLRTIGEQIGQVISIDNSKAYKAKLFGPRIRLLIRDLDSLPNAVVLPRLNREGTVEYKLEFSGLPNQCGRCRSREHQVRHCPKREASHRHKSSAPKEHQPTHPPIELLQQPTQKEDESIRLNGQPSLAAGETIETPNSPSHTPIATTPACTPPRPTETPILQNDDRDFPKLPSPTGQQGPSSPQAHVETPEAAPTQFVWRPKPTNAEPQQIQENKEKEEGGGGGKVKIPDSTPLTRQGYRWISLFLPYERNTEQVRRPAPVGSGGLG
jgi:hypothetical protein